MTALLKAALGPDFARLPAALRALHGGDAQSCRGQGSIAAAPGLVARMIARLAGFPPTGQRVAFEFSISSDAGHERWVRRFGAHVTQSTLMPAPQGCVYESFGPFRLTLRPTLVQDGFAISVTALHVLGLPVPKDLLPQTEVTERADPDGTIHFDIAARLPFFGPLIRYHGQMQLVRDGS